MKDVALTVIVAMAMAYGLVWLLRRARTVHHVHDMTQQFKQLVNRDFDCGKYRVIQATDMTFATGELSATKVTVCYDHRNYFDVLVIEGVHGYHARRADADASHEFFAEHPVAALHGLLMGHRINAQRWNPPPSS